MSGAALGVVPSSNAGAFWVIGGTPRTAFGQRGPAASSPVGAVLAPTDIGWVLDDLVSERTKSPLRSWHRWHGDD